MRLLLRSRLRHVALPALLLPRGRLYLRLPLLLRLPALRRRLRQRVARQRRASCRASRRGQRRLARVATAIAGEAQAVRPTPAIREPSSKRPRPGRSPASDDSFRHELVGAAAAAVPCQLCLWLLGSPAAAARARRRRAEDLLPGVELVRGDRADEGALQRL